jgi:hypothetical protein
VGRRLPDLELITFDRSAFRDTEPIPLYGRCNER